MNNTLSNLFLIAILLLGCAPWCSGKAFFRRPESKMPDPADAGFQSGDIIFIRIPHYPFEKISETTHCPANHVGILFMDPQKGWIVAESAVPLSRYTPLRKFLARSKNGWFAIRRVAPTLNAAQIDSLRTQCDSRMGILYDPGFDYQKGRLFCSKFVYDVFLNALGIPVGRLETFSELLAKHSNADLGFWQAWFLGNIPWQRRTVTPASQYADTAALSSVPGPCN